MSIRKTCKILTKYMSIAPASRWHWSYKSRPLHEVAKILRSWDKKSISMTKGEFRRAIRART